MFEIDGVILLSLKMFHAFLVFYILYFWVFRFCKHVYMYVNLFGKRVKSTAYRSLKS